MLIFISTRLNPISNVFTLNVHDHLITQKSTQISIFFQF